MDLDVVKGKGFLLMSVVFSESILLNIKSLVLLNSSNFLFSRFNSGLEEDVAGGDSSTLSSSTS